MLKKQILIIDNEEDIVTLIRYFLKKDGHAVTCFTDSRKALAELMNHHYKLIITDYCMYGLNGYELLTRARNRYDQAIIISSYLSEKKAAEIKAEKLAADFLEKPINSLKLRYIVKENMKNI